MTSSSSLLLMNSVYRLTFNRVNSGITQSTPISIDAAEEKRNFWSSGSCSMLKGITKVHKRTKKINLSPKILSGSQFLALCDWPLWKDNFKASRNIHKGFVATFPCFVLKTGIRQATVFQVHLREGSQRWSSHLFYNTSAQHTSPLLVWEPLLLLQCLLQIQLFSPLPPCSLTISTGKSWGKRYLLAAFSSFGVRKDSLVSRLFLNQSLTGGVCSSAAELVSGDRAPNISQGCSYPL